MADSTRARLAFSTAAHPPYVLVSGFVDVDGSPRRFPDAQILLSREHDIRAWKQNPTHHVQQINVRSHRRSSRAAWRRGRTSTLYWLSAASSGYLRHDRRG